MRAAASLKLTCARELAVLTHDRRGEQILVIPVRPPSAGGHGGRRGAARGRPSRVSRSEAQFALKHARRALAPARELAA